MNTHLGARSRTRADTLPRMPSNNNQGGIGDIDKDRDRSISISSPPLLLDNLSESSISIASSSVSSPSNTLLFLNLPQDPMLTNVNNFNRILAPFGQLISIKSIICQNQIDRVIIAQFANTNSAIICKNHLNTKELAPNFPCVISFVQILNLNLNLNLNENSNSNNGILGTASNNNNDNNNNNNNNINHHTINNSTNGLQPQLIPSPPSFVSNLNLFIQNLPPSSSSSNDFTNLMINKIKLHSSSQIKNQIHNQLKVFDTPSLRDIRKLLDSNNISQLYIDELTLSMDLDLPLISSDYLGNTIVQRLITDTSPEINLFIVNKLASHLPSLAIHKNGTWVAQKLVNSIPDDYKFLVMDKLIINLSPFIKDLICDTFGNYLVQAILNWSNDNYSNFIWVAIIHDFPIICCNRYGARALRTCLEFIEKSKLKLIENQNQNQIEIDSKSNIINLIISSILTWIWEISYDSNGSLIITWFLDGCKNLNQFEKYSLLTNSLISNNAKFLNVCSSKLGGLTIIKLLNFKSDNNIDDDILDINSFKFKLINKIFEADNLLYLIGLNSNQFGPNLINKILSLNLLDIQSRNLFIKQIQIILNDLTNQNPNIQFNHQLKRLADECGLRINHLRSSSMSNVWNNGANNLVNNNNNNNNNNNILQTPLSRDRSLSNLSNVSNPNSRSRSNSSPFMQNLTPPPYDPFLEDALLRQQLEGLIINNTNTISENNNNNNNMKINLMNNNNNPFSFPF